MEGAVTANGNSARQPKKPAIHLATRKAVKPKRLSISDTNPVVHKLKNFSENTTAHGIRRIFTARNAYTTRIWLLVILACLAVLFYQGQQLYHKFIRYEKNTKLEVQFYFDLFLLLFFFLLPFFLLHFFFIF